MATITQAIASLEQQLRELTYEDGTHVFEHVYAYATPESGIETPCAIIRPGTSTRLAVYAYLDANKDDPEKIFALAEACEKRWGPGGNVSWQPFNGTVYRTFSFSLMYG